MIWTVALVWYSLWWVYIAMSAIVESRLTVRDAFWGFFGCIWLPVVLPVTFVVMFKDVEIWRRK